MLTSCVAIIVLAIPGYLLLGTGDISLAILASVGLAIAFSGNYSVIHVMLIELFPNHHRATAYAQGYNVTTAALGGAAPLFLTALYAATGSLLLPAYFLGLTAVGTAAAAYLNKETAGRSLTKSSDVDDAMRFSSGVTHRLTDALGCLPSVRSTRREPRRLVRG